MTIVKVYQREKETYYPDALRNSIHFEEHGLVELKEYGIIKEEVSNQIQISDELLEGIQNRWLLTCSEPVKTPISVGFADPVLFRWEESWYLLATNDNVNDIGLFMKKATTKEGLFEEDVETFCILPYNEEEGWIQNFWAPEFHVIGGNVYILFALGGKQLAPQCHMMRLKQGGKIENESDWEKQPTPFLHTGCVTGELGPGHNSFFYDEEGRLYVAYHIQERNQYHKRCGTYHEMDQTAKGFLKLK